MKSITKSQFVKMLIDNGSSELYDINSPFEFDIKDYHTFKKLRKSAVVLLYMGYITISPELMSMALVHKKIDLIGFMLYFLERKYVQFALPNSGYLIQFTNQPEIIDAFVLEGSCYGPRERKVSSRIINAKENYIKTRVMKGVPEVLVKKVFKYLEITEYFEIPDILIEEEYIDSEEEP